jgi:predicted GNAT family N-acyltransferase
MLKATVHDANELTSLTKQSKAYWGYTTEQMEKWNEDLTISETYILKNHVYLERQQDQIVGYYSYWAETETKAKLDNLFIAPEHIGSGLGKQLLFDFLDRVKDEGYQIVILDADPHAAEFYKKFGFKVVGKRASSVSGRFLPIMELSVPETLK